MSGFPSFNQIFSLLLLCSSSHVSINKKNIPAFWLLLSRQPLAFSLCDLCCVVLFLVVLLHLRDSSEPGSRQGNDLQSATSVNILGNTKLAPTTACRCLFPRMFFNKTSCWSQMMWVTASCVLILWSDSQLSSLNVRGKKSHSVMVGFFSFFACKIGNKTIK